MNTVVKLQAALGRRILIQFSRRFEPGNMNGYVLGIGPHFALIAVVEEASRFNGFQCVRLSDVRDLQVPHKYAAFAESALKKRRQRRPANPRVNLGSVEALLISASRKFPLITIHREVVDPDVCHIGVVRSIVNGRVALQEITPSARWESEPTAYRLKEITRVDFGGEYEESLRLVGGAPSNSRLERPGARVARHSQAAVGAARSSSLR